MFEASNLEHRRYGFDDWILSDVKVSDLLGYLRRMNHRPVHQDGTVVQTSFWQQLFFGGNVFEASTEIPPQDVTPIDGGVVVRKQYSCRYSGGGLSEKWKIEVNFKCSMRSFSIVENAKDGTDYIGVEKYKFKDTWYDEDITGIDLIWSFNNNAEAEIRRLMSRFRHAEKWLANPLEWVGLDLNAAVQCRCGRVTIMEASTLCDQTECDNIFQLKSRLRCTDCGEKGGAEILPWFTPFGIQRLPSAVRFSSDPRRAHENENIGVRSALYKVMDGDGQDNVYLGDGMSIQPDGSLAED